MPPTERRRDHLRLVTEENTAEFTQRLSGRWVKERAEFRKLAEELRELKRIEREAS